MGETGILARNRMSAGCQPALHDRAGAGRANHGGQAKHWLFRRAPRTTRTTHNGISWTGAPTCACLSVPGACRTRRNGRRAHTRALTGRAHGLSNDGRGRCATRSHSPQRQRLRCSPGCLLRGGAGACSSSHGAHCHLAVIHGGVR
jgi:hypothetical protein